MKFVFLSSLQEKNLYAMKKTIFLLSVLLMPFTVLMAQTIDTNASVVTFKITGGGFFKVNGDFTGMQGDFNFDENDLENSSFNICIDATSIDTNNEKRDNHLKSDDFFNVEKYPEICFKSTNITTKDNHYATTGELTMHGITKTVEIPFKFSNNTFKGTFQVLRLDYNIGEDFGSFRVGHEAEVSINCVVKQ